MTPALEQLCTAVLLEGIRLADPACCHTTCRCVMVTGDHLRTAVSVAHQCGIMPDNRPICLIDGNDRNSSEPPFRISVLNTDGTVNEGVAKAAILPKVLLGDYEVAVTGKGFSRMLDSPDPDVVQVGGQAARLWAWSE